MDTPYDLSGSHELNLLDVEMLNDFDTSLLDQYTPNLAQGVEDLSAAGPFPPTVRLGQPRLYQLAPQDDPEMEKKRRRAMKAHQNRQKESQRNQQLRLQVEQVINVTRATLAENQQLKVQIRQLEDQIRAVT